MTDASGAPPADVEGLKSWCAERLGPSATEASVDPLGNGVRRLSFALAHGLDDGELALPALADLVAGLCRTACLGRAQRLRALHQRADADPASDVAAMLAPFEGASFAEFKAAVERSRAGVVFTAHPTFANPKPLRDAMAAFASPDGPGDEAAFVRAIAGAPQASTGGVTLFHEHAEAMDALARAQDAIGALTEEILRWARGRWPGRWRELAPIPISLATWVGYDLDGRTDIHWAQTFRLRLEEKAAQLARYVDAISAASDTSGLAALSVRLDAAARLTREQAALFAENLDDPATVVAAANHLTAEHPDRLVTLEPAIETLTREIADAADDEAALALCAVRASMRNYGLGVGRIHLRVNAAQVRSTLASDLGVAPEGGFLNRTTLAAAAEAAKDADATARRINFASVFTEKMTARRQLMLCAQFLKHVDADAPIRFLIAECEAPATVMGAVFLARHYGVDHRVDVSPLFETPDALESGGRFMERLLDEPAYRDYIERRGRVAIQLGFSDSGRFMGQIAADMAIERVHVLLAREMGKRGIRNVEALLFNTHGESMGRGGFPGDFKGRFDLLLSPWARARCEHEGVATNAESSFQGGDGFMHFATPALAASTVGAMARWAFAPIERDAEARFYTDLNFSWDVYRTIKSWQEDLYEAPAYQTALSAFAPNLLLASGSRKTRRQSGASAGDVARSLRAIPNNAILQQLAAPANVFGGLGAGAGRDVDRFRALVASSARMGGLMTMARTARDLTSLAILRAYADMYDPAFWTIRARHAGQESDVEAFNRVASRLAAFDHDVALSRLANHLSVDRRRFDRAGEEGGPGGPAREPAPQDLYLLHAARMAAMMHGVALVAGLPAFSGRHEVTHDDLVDRCLAMRFDDVADLIAEIFPMAGARDATFDGLTEPSDPVKDADDGGYPDVHASVVAPLRACAALIREITAGVAHFYGAYG
ncbi:MAG: phosphoenolpyruvate carboxylase [Parvularculaceae bacterium]